MTDKKKFLLYFPLDLHDSKSGLATKCRGIAQAFAEKYQVDIISASDEGIWWNDVKCFDPKQNWLRKTWYFLLDRTLGYYRPLHKIIERNPYDALYFRFHYFITPGMILFLKLLKKKNPSLQVFMEIPTYPYETELYNLSARIRFYLGKFLLPSLRRLVTRIITVSEHDAIFGIKTLRIENGYFSELSTLPSLPESNQPPGFHIGMIANFNPWHGPDILVNSLIRYYQDTREAYPSGVHLHMIGTGEELESAKHLVQESGMRNFITFYGSKNRNEILEISAKVHVMVGTMGHFRKGISLSSSLKSREYAFLGKPLILKTRDKDFPASLFFVKYFPDDESLLDIPEIIRFYQDMKTLHPDYRNEIRQYALDHLGWNSKLKDVMHLVDQINHS